MIVVFFFPNFLAKDTSHLVQRLGTHSDIAASTICFLSSGHMPGQRLGQSVVSRHGRSAGFGTDLSRALSTPSRVYFQNFGGECTHSFPQNLCFSVRTDCNCFQVTVFNAPQCAKAPKRGPYRGREHKAQRRYNESFTRRIPEFRIRDGRGATPGPAC